MAQNDEFRMTTADLWRLLTIQSAAIVVSGLGLAWWFELEIFLQRPDLWELLLGIGLAVPLILSSMVFSELFNSYDKVLRAFQRILGPALKPGHIPFLALMSAVVEEYFFRGVLQPLLGIVPAAFLFGLVHVWNRLFLIHGIWAAFAGLYLGFIYQMTGNLWIPVATHALNNLIGFWLLRREWEKG